jgi:hypothetical protein
MQSTDYQTSPDSKLVKALGFKVPFLDEWRIQVIKFRSAAD